MNTIDDLLRALGWSQAQLANYLGCHQSTVTRMADGSQPPNKPIARLLARLEHLVTSGKALPGMSVDEVVRIAIGSSEADPSMSQIASA